ncbi:hypothetical protein RHGRI_009895 [Rhododendron griersonianum]|uniref:F-box domain-containing protein n=1 Tax=Rhododendron griersonianum TaxID=479676 RepID=A0AAV6KH92_9ERIC|nr:hypothetical protein RHGRI_009895 [Rhododendron griersonianum]
MRRSKRIARQNTSTAAVAVSELPNHIICDILSRLPINSILTCKRVCKAWRNLTLDPYIAKLRISRFPLSLIFYRHSTNTNTPSHFEILQLHDPTDFGHRSATMKFTTGIYFPHMDIDKVGSCNGLILLSNHPSKDLVIVCNPLSAQHFVLPKPPKLGTKAYSSFVGFGFGHCTSTDQYKVLRFTKTHRPTRLMDIAIYTLGVDDEWRSLGDTAQPPCIFTSKLVFLNGAFHWIGFENSRVVCYLDIEKEQFGSFPLPSHIGNDFTYFGVVDNWLYLRHRSGVLKFWVMKDYGDFGSWTLECVVENPFHGNGFVEPLKILEDGSLLLMMVYSQPSLDRKRPKEEKITLASCNPRTRVLKKIEHRGILLEDTPYAYVPCFFSPMGALV